MTQPTKHMHGHEPPRAPRAGGRTSLRRRDAQYTPHGDARTQLPACLSRLRLAATSRRCTRAVRASKVLRERVPFARAELLSRVVSLRRDGACSRSEARAHLVGRACRPTNPPYLRST